MSVFILALIWNSRMNRLSAAALQIFWNRHFRHYPWFILKTRMLNRFLLLMDFLMMPLSEERFRWQNPRFEVLFSANWSLRKTLFFSTSAPEPAPLPLKQHNRFLMAVFMPLNAIPMVWIWSKKIVWDYRRTTLPLSAAPLRKVLTHCRQPPTPSSAAVPDTWKRFCSCYTAETQKFESS